jgi:hypothetical protein
MLGGWINVGCANTMECWVARRRLVWDVEECKEAVEWDVGVGEGVSME